MKRCLIVFMLALTFLGVGIPVYASNIAFDVTVGGSGTQDPLSKRTKKAQDNDNNAYYRATETSNTKGYIMVASYNLNNQSICTPQLTQLCSINVGRTLTRPYNVQAPEGEYYFMKAETDGPRINVKGYYCP